MYSSILKETYTLLYYVIICIYTLNYLTDSVCKEKYAQPVARGIPFDQRTQFLAPFIVKIRKIVFAELPHFPAKFGVWPLAGWMW